MKKLLKCPKCGTIPKVSTCCSVDGVVYSCSIYCTSKNCPNFANGEGYTRYEAKKYALDNWNNVICKEFNND